MANENLQCFQSTATDFLRNEISKQQDAKVDIGNINFSAKTVANDSIGALFQKGPRGVAKSIQQHLDDFANQTLNFANQVVTDATGIHQDILSAFNQFRSNDINSTVDSTFRSMLTMFSTSPTAVFSLAKNSSSRTSSQATQRVSLANDIINLINNMKQVRAAIGPDLFSKEPNQAAADTVSLIDQSTSLLQIVISGIENAGEDAVQVPRREASYNRAVENMSDALDELKIGEGSFRLTEYLKLRLDFKILINQYSDIDLEIQDTTLNTINAVTEFEAGQEEVARVEANYVREVKNRLEQLSRDIQAVLDRENESLTLENFSEWSDQLLALYTLSHNALDRDMQNLTLDTSTVDRQDYDSAAAAYSNLRPQVDAQELVAKMNDLAETYFNALRPTVTILESTITEKEEDVKADLVEIAQLDQQLVSTNSAYSPNISELIGILGIFTGRSGIDKLSEALDKGSVSGVFGFLTEKLGARAAEAAGCLSSEISGIDNLETREILLQANARIQAIQRKKQLIGTAREGLATRATKSIDSSIERTNNLVAQIESLNL